MFKLSSLQASPEEKHRQVRRPEIKKALALAEAKRAEINDILLELRKLDQAEAEAVTDHQNTTVPRQSRKAEIAEQVADLRLAGKEVPAALVTERQQLEHAIVDANNLLDTIIESLKKRRRLLVQRRSALESEVRELLKLRGQLFSAELAHPKLLEKLHVADQGCIWAEKRRDAARAELQNAEHRVRLQERSITTSQIPADTQAHCRRLMRELEQAKAELEAAERLMIEANHEREQVREVVIAE